MTTVDWNKTDPIVENYWVSQIIDTKKKISIHQSIIAIAVLRLISILEKEDDYII